MSTELQSPLACSRSDVQDTPRGRDGGQVEAAGVDLCTQLMLNNCTCLVSVVM